MFRHELVAFTLLAAMADASAGRIYGTLQNERRAVPEGREIYVVCPPQHDDAAIQQRNPTGMVSRYGRYSVEAPVDGECTFAVRLNDGLAHTPIISFGNPTRYDFIIIRRGDRNVIERKH